MSKAQRASVKSGWSQPASAMTDRFLLRSCGQCNGKSRVRGHHLQCLVGPLWAVKKGDAVGNHSRGLDLALKAVSMHTLVLQRPNHALRHRILLQAVWRDEILLQAIVAHRSHVGAAGENQSVVAASSRRVRQSITNAKLKLPSFPPQTGQRSVAQR